MLYVILRDLLLFAAALTGLALPAWRWLGWARGIERLSLALAAALLTGYLAVFSLYIAELPLRWFWVLPAAGLLSALARPAAWGDLPRDPAVRALLGRWSVLVLWCLGWHGFVFTYSGGGWTGDWVEHYDRANFFLQHWPVGHLFLDFYPLPARPPLANLWAAGLLALSGGGFAHYQIFSTLLSSLVLFPLTVLLGQWRAGGRAANLLLILLMLSPLFVQNATFPWTKLPAAFFVLLAITQLSPAAGAPTRARFVAGSLLLAGGMLTHYSAGPWLCGLGIAYGWTHRHRWRDRDFLRPLLFGALLAGLLLATWLSWSSVVYGLATTFMGNTTLTLSHVNSFSEWVMNALTNLWCTFSPLAANTEVPILQQSSRLGQWRDHWFLFFQLKLPFAFGSMGAAVMLWQLFRSRRSPEGAYWWIALPVIVVLGTATVTMPVKLGLTQIALQPLVLLGLAWLAARADRLPRWLTRVWIGGLVLDFCLGILLHFAVQSLWIERWFHPNSSIPQILMGYNWPARANYMSKAELHLTFLADIASPLSCLTLVLAGGIMAGAWLYRGALVSRQS